MKAKLILNNPLWQTAQRRRILDRVVQQSAVELESEIKRKILTGTKSGRTYRRGAITKAASQKNIALGLRRVRGNSKQVFAGSKLHRASAPGESPANDSGGLANSLRSVSVKPLHSKVFTSKRYAETLDNPRKLNRPFFSQTAQKFKKRFKEQIKNAIGEMKK